MQFGKMPGFEVPSEMRAFAEKSVEQAKTAFDNYMSQALKALGTVEGTADAAQSGVRDMSKQALGYAEENVASAFAFAEKLVRARDAQEIMQLQSEFAKETMQKLSDQTKSLGEQVAKGVKDTTERLRT